MVFATVAVITSMAAIFVHERERAREVEADSAEIRQVRRDITLPTEDASTGLLISNMSNKCTIMTQMDGAPAARFLENLQKEVKELNV